MNLQIKDLIKQLSQTEKVNCDDLIYRYKGKTSDENFDKYDNALDLIDKIKNGEIELRQKMIKKILNQVQAK